MAQPRAVVDVVAAETQPHQFLEQVGLFVAALAEPKPASVRGPWVLRSSRSALPAWASASSQLASRKYCIAAAGSAAMSACLGASARRISGTVRRCGWRA